MQVNGDDLISFALGKEEMGLDIDKYKIACKVIIYNGNNYV